ncbi:MAG: cytochrome c oxidase assembly protein [Chloroflexi bacterium]|nr:MAG: cytochrome c oxidase assembly protein [Chloroflexota bacterium]
MPGLSGGDPARWPIEPLVLLAVEVAAILYLRGGRSARRRPGRWSADALRPPAFAAGLGVVLLALDGPIEAYARTLFWVHMTQHLLLITLAAPLLVAAAPGLRLWRGLPLRLRRPAARLALRHPAFKPLRRAAGWISRPAPVFALATVNLWFWHLPAAYDLTLRNHAVHHLEHTLFLGLGLLFWAQVIDQPPFRVSLNQFQRLMYVFAGLTGSWALAAVLALAPGALYAYAALPVHPGGISALTDQQIGAGIMWVPGSFASSIAIVWCLLLWLRDEERAGQAPAMAPAGGSSR